MWTEVRNAVFGWHAEDDLGVSPLPSEYDTEYFDSVDSSLSKESLLSEDEESSLSEDEDDEKVVNNGKSSARKKLFLSLPHRSWSTPALSHNCVDTATQRTHKGERQF